MSFLGSALAPVIGLAGSLIGANMQNSASSAFQAQSYAYSKESMQNRHQWEVEDLKKAGLNPILSANNSSGGVISVGTPSAAQVDIPKALEQIANSALARKDEQLREYSAETDRIKANADMLRAKQDEAKTASAIELTQAQTGTQKQQAKYLVKSAEMMDKNYELQKVYTQAQVKEIDQRIINSVAEVKAKIQYLQDSGRAALMSASAAQVQAQAAMQNAASQAIIASVARENGISQRQLNDALQGKASAETKEAYERALNVAKKTDILDWQKQKDIIHNPYGANDGIGRALMGAGEILRNGISGASGFLP